MVKMVKYLENPWKIPGKLGEIYGHVDMSFTNGYKWIQMDTNA